MKKIISISVLLFSIAVITGCDKETGVIAETQPVTSDQALLKINYVSNYAANPGVQLKLNGIRVSDLITARTPFPGGGYNTGGGSTNDYLAVTPGNVALTVAIPKRLTATDSIVLFNTSVTSEAGKNYSAHITDTAANTKLLVLEDDLTRPDTGSSRYRFVNLMPDVPAIDLYYGTTVVATNIRYLQSSPYFNLSRPTTSLAWTIRETGTSATSTALATYTSANTTVNQRVYTAFASGFKRATDAPRKPYISFYLVN
jgi:hypothetical protein